MRSRQSYELMGCNCVEQHMWRAGRGKFVVGHFKGSTGYHTASYIEYDDESLPRVHCSCIGFSARGWCKHLNAVMNFVGGVGLLDAIPIDDFVSRKLVALKSSLKALNELFNDAPYSNDAIFAIYGKPKVGKSLLMLQEAVWFESLGKNVLFIDTEGSLRGFARQWLHVLRSRFESEKRGRIYAIEKKSLESLLYYMGRHVTLVAKGSEKSPKMEFNIVSPVKNELAEFVEKKSINAVIIDSVTAPIREAIPSAQQNHPAKCLDAETKVLTRRGWLGYKDIRVGDEVLSYDIRTGELKWKPVIDVYISEYDGDMIKIGGERTTVDILVTPNHKMVVESLIENKKKKIVRFRKASELAHLVDRIVRTGRWDGHEYSFITIPGYNGRRRSVKEDIVIPADRFFEFLGLYIAEGWLKKNCRDGEPYMICISQRSDRRKDEVERILRGVSDKWRYYESMGSYCLGDKRFAKYFAEVLGLNVHATEKFVPVWVKEASVGLLRKLLNGIIVGDGSVHKGEMLVYTHSKRLAEDIAEVALKAGFAVNIYERDVNTDINGYRYETNSYVVALLEKQNGYWIRKKFVKRVKYKGIIWSPEVADTHTFVAMRNGKVFITGNSDATSLLLGRLIELQEKYDVAILTTHHGSFNPANPYDTMVAMRGGVAVYHYCKNIVFIDAREKAEWRDYRRFWLIRAPDKVEWSEVTVARITDLGYIDVDVDLRDVLTDGEKKRVGLSGRRKK